MTNLNIRDFKGRDQNVKLASCNVKNKLQENVRPETATDDKHVDYLAAHPDEIDMSTMAVVAVGGGRFDIVAGFHRFKAMQKNGVKSFRIYVLDKSHSKKDLEYIAFCSNLSAHKQLKSSEMAKGLLEFIKSGHFTEEEAKEIGGATFTKAYKAANVDTSTVPGIQPFQLNDNIVWGEKEGGTEGCKKEPKTQAALQAAKIFRKATDIQLPKLTGIDQLQKRLLEKEGILYIQCKLGDNEYENIVAKFVEMTEEGRGTRVVIGFYHSDSVHRTWEHSNYSKCQDLVYAFNEQVKPKYAINVSFLQLERDTTRQTIRRRADELKRDLAQTI
jgi:hypothetical protein